MKISKYEAVMHQASIKQVKNQGSPKTIKQVKNQGNPKTIKQVKNQGSPKTIKYLLKNANKKVNCDSPSAALWLRINPAGIYLFKINSKNTKVNNKTTERR